MKTGIVGFSSNSHDEKDFSDIQNAYDALVDDFTKLKKKKYKTLYQS